MGLSGYSSLDMSIANKEDLFICMDCRRIIRFINREANNNLYLTFANPLRSTCFVCGDLKGLDLTRYVYFLPEYVPIINLGEP